ncbi:cupin domain-containing protein [Thermotoga caldifontis]|uniref:cupin domain-containing protein n=1 Tax=Thermotoga caldifontis TaxID=1508419 RepID=UPI000596D7D2|nr:cupin domain-containing protein [Thermotoga caldifontis]
MNVFAHLDQVTPKKVKEGIEMRVLVWAGKMMMTHVTFKKGSVGDLHSHPHEQISYVVEGELIYRVGEEKYHMKAGSAIYVPSNVKHQVEALTDAVLLDIFTPIREDYLPQSV